MRLSASELNAWRSCRLRHHYSYGEGLALPEKGPMLASGTAVHGAVEAVLKGEIPYDLSAAKAEEILRDNLAGRDDLEVAVKKYLPGAVRALSRMPKWAIEPGWQVEELIEWTWPEHDITLFGFPDMYRVEDDHIIIGELKSTSNTRKVPSDYFLFNPQHRYYAVVLSKLYPDKPIFVKYAVVHTGKTGPRLQQGEWLMKKRALAQAEQEILATAGEIGKLPVVPSYTNACGYCDFKPLCAAAITGGDPAPLKRELYVPKPLTRERNSPLDIDLTT